MKILFLVICTTILLLACNKGNDTPTYTIAGHIYKKADSTPYANTSFVVYQDAKGSVLSGKDSETTITPFTTDSSGYFNVSFKWLKGSSEISIRWPGAGGKSIQPINTLSGDSATKMVIYAN